MFRIFALKLKRPFIIRSFLSIFVFKYSAVVQNLDVATIINIKKLKRMCRYNYWLHVFSI